VLVFSKIKKDMSRQETHKQYQPVATVEEETFDNDRDKSDAELHHQEKDERHKATRHQIDAPIKSKPVVTFSLGPTAVEQDNSDADNKPTNLKVFVRPRYLIRLLLSIFWASASLNPCPTSRSKLSPVTAIGSLRPAFHDILFGILRDPARRCHDIPTWPRLTRVLPLAECAVPFLTARCPAAVPDLAARWPNTGFQVTGIDFQFSAHYDFSTS
jgi:hypothetical protein